MKLAWGKYIFLLAIVVKFRRVKWRVGEKLRIFAFMCGGYKFWLSINYHTIKIVVNWRALESSLSCHKV